MATSENASCALKLFAFALMTTVLVALVLQRVVSADALAPAVVTALFLGAGALAAWSRFQRRPEGSVQARHATRQTDWLSIAGTLTFIGVAVSFSIDSEEIIRLLVFSDQPE